MQGVVAIEDRKRSGWNRRVIKLLVDGHDLLKGVVCIPKPRRARNRAGERPEQHGAADHREILRRCRDEQDDAITLLDAACTKSSCRLTRGKPQLRVCQALFAPSTVEQDERRGDRLRDWLLSRGAKRSRQRRDGGIVLYRPSLKVGGVTGTRHLSGCGPSNHRPTLPRGTHVNSACRHHRLAESSRRSREAS